MRAVLSVWLIALIGVPSASTALAQARGNSRDVPVIVGLEVKAPKRIKTVVPEYPEQAAKGSLIFELLVTPEGSVDSVEVIREVRGATDAAVEAVKQWKYEPLIYKERPSWFKIRIVVPNPWRAGQGLL